MARLQTKLNTFYYDSGEMRSVPSSPVEKQTEVVVGAFVQSAEFIFFLTSVRGSEKELRLPDRSRLL